MKPGADSIEGRASLTLSQCVPCKQRGHYCEAQTEIDGEPWCNACADGVPCMHELIERRRRDKDVSATSKLPAERYRSVKIDGPRKIKPRREERFCGAEGCTRRITASNKTGLCGDHDQREEAELDAVDLETLAPPAEVEDEAVEQRELEQFLAGEESGGETAADDHGLPDFATAAHEVTDVTSSEE